MVKKLISKSDYSDLTIGKEYFIVDEGVDTYEILDDNGDLVNIQKYRFEEE